ncbi:hypothetical protein PilKf_00564 [Pillotina sp. SPG140]|jgi:chemotaxis protein histidine kinase CheA
MDSIEEIEELYGEIKMQTDMEKGTILSMYIPVRTVVAKAS